LPQWTPWLIAAVSLVSGLAFNVYDRTVARARAQAIVETKLADLETMLNQVEDKVNQIAKVLMTEAREKHRRSGK